MLQPWDRSDRYQTGLLAGFQVKVTVQLGIGEVAQGRSLHKQGQKQAGLLGHWRKGVGLCSP